MLKKIISVVFIFTLLPSTLLAKNITLFGTQSDSYQFAQLQNALSYLPEKNYQLSNFKGAIPKHRAFDFMNNQKGIDVIFGGSTLARENMSTPVRIPILKGLNGWRIPLVNKNKVEFFKTVKSIDEFKKLVPGQFHRWSDTRVLESNNIEVAKVSDYESLYHMLDKERIDYFPLSILEVKGEYQPRKHLNITIDKNLIVHYPTAYYFYVGKNNQALADDILFGLEQAISDDSFNEIFLQYHGEVINDIRKIKRRVFSLDNPYLSIKTPLSRTDLWINLHPEKTARNRLYK